ERGDRQREAEGDHADEDCGDYPANPSRCQALPKKAVFRGCRIQKNPYVLAPFMMPETSSPRIPTIRKAHLPPGFAYPVGSGAVSEVLISVPQFPKFTLSFSNVTPLLRPQIV